MKHIVKAILFGAAWCVGMYIFSDVSVEGLIIGTIFVSIFAGFFLQWFGLRKENRAEKRK